MGLCFPSLGFTNLTIHVTGSLTHCPQPLTTGTQSFQSSASQIKQTQWIQSITPKKHSVPRQHQQLLQLHQKQHKNNPTFHIDMVQDLNNRFKNNQNNQNEVEQVVSSSSDLHKTWDHLVFSEDQAIDQHRRFHFDTLRTMVSDLASKFKSIGYIALMLHQNVPEFFSQSVSAPATCTDPMGDTIADSFSPAHTSSSFPSHVIKIKSLLFQIANQSDPILVILDTKSTVNVSKLQGALARLGILECYGSTSRLQVYLAPKENVESLCGFTPKSVPPLLWSLSKPNTYVITILDERLTEIPDQTAWQIDHDDDAEGFDVAVIENPAHDPAKKTVLWAGGGHPCVACCVSLNILQSFHSTYVADISKSTSSPTTADCHQHHLRENYFQTDGVPSRLHQSQLHSLNNCDAQTADTTTFTAIANTTTASFPKPYFAVPTPDSDHAKYFIQNQDLDHNLVSQPFTLVGRLTKVRRMSRTLVFCDFAPLDSPDMANSSPKNQTSKHYTNPTAGTDTVHATATASANVNPHNDLERNGDSDNRDPHTQALGYDLPWKSPVDQADMAVQLIAGKTFCKSKSGDQGTIALKTLKAGQILLVRGKINVASPNSLRNWVSRRLLDIIVIDFIILDIQYSLITPALTMTMTTSDDPLSSKEERVRVIAQSQTMTGPTTKKQDSRVNCIASLRLSDLCTNIKPVHIVDTLDAVRAFHQSLIFLSRSITLIDDNRQETNPQRGSSSASTEINSLVLVGVDCEWKPSFMLESSEKLQPVLLLQVSIQRFGQVYLIDTQTLLRPCLDPSEPLNKVEDAISQALTHLFLSTHYIKIGFQLKTDLYRLVESFPHIPAFHLVHSAVQVDKIARKTMYAAKIKSSDSNQIVSSLANLTKYLVQKPLDKEQQISDWSQRPLSREQIHYAALDAAVTPAILEKLLENGGVRWHQHSRGNGGYYLGRFQDDELYANSISSVRFVFMDSDEHVWSFMEKRLKAKKLVTGQYLVQQCWITGDDEPDLPSLPRDPPSNNKLTTHKPQNFVRIQYTDLNGVLRIPSVSVSLRNSNLDSLVGRRIGRSKESCLDALVDLNKGIPQKTKLDFYHRSGYVEFADGAALFVNAPSKRIDEAKLRSYPNVWLQDGRFMTWFLRGSDWRDGNSPLAQKLLGRANTDDVDSHVMQIKAFLFVRTRKGDFICCGRVEIYDGPKDEKRIIQPWELVEFKLKLMDWEELRRCTEFTTMVFVGKKQQQQQEQERNTKSLPVQIADMVIDGNLVDAMGLALLNSPSGQKSVQLGLESIQEILRHADYNRPNDDDDHDDNSNRDRTEYDNNQDVADEAGKEYIFKIVSLLKRCDHGSIETTQKYLFTHPTLEELNQVRLNSRH